MSSNRTARRPPIPGLPADFADGHPEASRMAAAWLEAVTRHRRAVGAFGRVSASVVTTPDGLQVHLTEETTFRAKAAGPCPFAAAVDWLQIQAARRREHNLTGTGRLEFEDKPEQFTGAKVVETTIIVMPDVDGRRIS